MAFAVFFLAADLPQPRKAAAASGVGARAQRYRHALGKLSKSPPPLIVRPEAGAAIGAREFAAAFERYRDGLCARHEDVTRAAADSDYALWSAWTSSGPALGALRQSLSARGVTRTAGRDVLAYLDHASGDALREGSGCALLAVVDALQSWPEAEPDSLLGRIAEDPPDGSSALRVRALDAIGDTGRADYVALLGRIVRPETDGPAVWHAIASSIRITGDAELALRVVDPDFPFTEEIAAGLPSALVAASGPKARETVRALLASGDTLRLRTGLRSVQDGVAMPDALDDLVHAARTATLSGGDAGIAIEAISTAGPVAPRILAGLAGDATAAADVRVEALVALDTPERPDLARQIAAAGPSAEAAIALARLFQEADPIEARQILEIYAGKDGRREALAAAILAAHAPALADLARGLLVD